MPKRCVLAVGLKSVKVELNKFEKLSPEQKSYMIDDDDQVDDEYVATQTCIGNAALALIVVAQIRDYYGRFR